MATRPHTADPNAPIIKRRVSTVRKPAKNLTSRQQVSSDLPLRSVLAIKEVSTLEKGGFRIRFHDRRAALMDLARLRGMVTGKSASFHFHEDLARMSPDEQKRRVAELLELAASIKVPGDGAVDVTPDEDDETE